jgi:hypothetical protein
VAALAVEVCHSLRIEDSADFVRFVAVYAGGDHMGLFFPQLTADHFAMNGLNLRMTLRAGLGDVLLGNGRSRVRVRQNKVRRVATRAHRRDDQAAAKQTFAMHAFRVVLKNLVLRDVVSELDRRALVMAASAEKGNLGNIGGRAGSGRAQDVVSSVTIRAARGQRVTTLRRIPVQARRILLLFVGMTGAALNRFQLLGMGKLFCGQLGVATGAFKLGVGRRPQRGLVKGRRHPRLPLAYAAPCLVAIQAGFTPRQGLGLLRVSTPDD